MALNCRAGAPLFPQAVAGASFQIRFHTGAEMPRLTLVDATLILDHVLGDISVPPRRTRSSPRSLSPSTRPRTFRRAVLLRRPVADPVSTSSPPFPPAPPPWPDEAAHANYRVLAGQEKSHDILSKLEEASAHVNPISTPEVRKVIHALQTSCNDLHRSVLSTSCCKDSCR